ncbi:hypothetical protein HZS61_015877 [Fusarium oxysporum f. sp. conglutinans]|uniref:Heterokaryon incompatibility domain-containing protein n=1 Tax=Fusarium oxysporum f. sp. conglutinans TaxID=100902 RepID=A0A8H6GP34_FUSOX|nr:hypothetical protein HZS61_015877 [Fusarium oxysporum f. sp. conglutinans]
MTLLEDIQGNGASGKLSPDETSNIAILNNFFSRSYFALLWIVQELLLAQSITFHCGEISLTVNNQSISLLYEKGVKIPSWVRYAGKMQSNTERSPMDLRDLLIATSVCQVTDLRDKVFGLLGLVSAVEASDLSPDYELMVREVYIGVAGTCSVDRGPKLPLFISGRARDIPPNLERLGAFSGIGNLA